MFTKLLKNAVKFCGKNKSTLGILHHVRVNVTNGLMTVCATNLEQFYVTTIQTEFPNCDFLIHKDMVKSIGKVKSKLISIDYNSDTETTQLNFDGTSFKIDSSYSVLDFPKAPQLGSIDTFELFDVSDYMIHLNTAKNASHGDAAKVMLNGVNISDQGIKATDGYRFFEYDVKFDGVEVTIPKNSIDLAYKLFKKSSNVKLAVTDSHACFFTENEKVWSRLIEGKFPQTDRIKPKYAEYAFTVNVKDFLDKLKPMQVNSQTQVFTMYGNKLTSENSNVTLNTDCPIEVSFNKIYMQELLTGLKDLGINEVTFNLNSDVQPMYIRQDDLFYMVMPVKP